MSCSALTCWLAGVAGGQFLLCFLCLSVGETKVAVTDGVQVLLGFVMLCESRERPARAVVPAALYGAACFIGLACEAVASFGPALHDMGGLGVGTPLGTSRAAWLAEAHLAVATLSPVLSLAGAVLSLLHMVRLGLESSQQGRGERCPLVAKEVPPPCWPRSPPSGGALTRGGGACSSAPSLPASCRDDACSATPGRPRGGEPRYPRAETTAPSPFKAVLGSLPAGPPERRTPERRPPPPERRPLPKARWKPPPPADLLPEPGPVP